MVQVIARLPGGLQVLTALTLQPLPPYLFFRHRSVFPSGHLQCLPFAFGIETSLVLRPPSRSRRGSPCLHIILPRGTSLATLTSFSHTPVTASLPGQLSLTLLPPASTLLPEETFPCTPDLSRLLPPDSASIGPRLCSSCQSCNFI